MIDAKASETVVAGGVGRWISPALWSCGQAVDTLWATCCPWRIHGLSTTEWGLSTLSMPLKKGNIYNHKDDSKLGRFMTMKQVYGVSSYEIINNLTLTEGLSRFIFVFR